MKLLDYLSSPEASQIINSGGVGVIRTDTLYGLVARAADEKAVERIYELKNRNDSKPLIVLVASLNQLICPPSKKYTDFLNQVWPGKTSVIIDSADAPDYLTRGTGTIAYRLPDLPELRQLIEKTGPLVAPSANPEGLKPAMTTAEAIDYFGEAVDFYVDGGQVADETPSALYRLGESNVPEQLR